MSDEVGSMLADMSNGLTDEALLKLSILAPPESMANLFGSAPDLIWAGILLSVILSCFVMEGRYWRPGLLPGFSMVATILTLYLAFHSVHIFNGLIFLLLMALPDWPIQLREMVAIGIFGLVVFFAIFGLGTLLEKARSAHFRRYLRRVYGDPADPVETKSRKEY